MTSASANIPSSPVKSLREELRSALPTSFHGKIRYLCTAPKRCEPLFSAPPGSLAEPTRLASHFLTVSIDAGPASTSTSASGVIVLGIEALVYTTKRLTTIFVSKADSTGYLPHVRPSASKTIATTFISWLVEKQQASRPRRKIVVSLFARSQSQYLFPGSAENSKKHVLDDRQLIKWWISVLDPIARQQDDPKMLPSTISRYRGYISVPGYEGAQELRPFLPLDNLDSHGSRRWSAGHPLLELATTRQVPTVVPVRCVLPRFPDDPKARFMQDLDDEAGIIEDATQTLSPSKRKAHEWGSIRSLERFWEAMAFRQECSSGRVVGFLWLVVDPQPAGSHAEDYSATGSPTEKSLKGIQSRFGTHAGSATPRKRKPLTGPIVARQPRLKDGGRSEGNLRSEAADDLVLTHDGYDRAMNTLLHLDFANLEVALQSTAKWVTEICSILGVQQDWAVEISGTTTPVNSSATKVCNGTHANVINDLGGMVRKKRKADAAVMPDNCSIGGASPVNVLGTGLIRKKLKPVNG